MNPMPSTERHRYDTRETLEAIDFQLARPDQIDRITDLYQHFFAESDLPEHGLVFSPSRMRLWVANGIVGGRIPHLVAIERDTGTIVGVLSYWIDQSFTTEPFASLEKFYVRKSWRFSAIGRTLLTLAQEAARTDGATVFRAGLSSGVAYSKNLFLRLGFTETLGSVLMVRKL
jgi:L-amino acid N-acyltransferase YncA